MVNISEQMESLVRTVKGLIRNYGYIEGPLTQSYPWGSEEYFNVISPSLRQRTRFPESKGVPESWTITLEHTNGYFNSEVYGDSRLEDFVGRYPEHGLQIIDESNRTVKTGDGSYRLASPGEDAYTLRLRHGSVNDPKDKEVAKSIGRVWDALFYLFEPSKMSRDELKRAEIVADLVTSLAPHKGLWSSYKKDLRRMYLLSPAELSTELERLAEMAGVIDQKARKSLNRLERSLESLASRR